MDEDRSVEENESEAESLSSVPDFCSFENYGKVARLRFEDGCDDALRRWVDEGCNNNNDGGEVIVETVAADFEAGGTRTNLDPLIHLFTTAPSHPGTSAFRHLELLWLGLGRSNLDVSTRILQAISQSHQGSIRKLSVKWSAIDIAALTVLIGTTTHSVVELEFFNCTIIGDFTEREKMELTQAVRSNTRIRTLEFWCPRNPYIVPIMLQLPCLQELSLDFEMMIRNTFDDAKEALEGLLRTSTTLRHLKLGSYSFKEEEQDSLLQNLLMKSTTLTKLTFKDFYCSGYSGFGFLGRIIQGNHMIQSLQLEVYEQNVYDFFSRENLQLILAPSSKLKNLSIRLSTPDARRAFSSLMGALATAPPSLEYLDIGCIHSVDNFNAFVDCVAKLHHVQEIRFQIYFLMLGEISRDSLMTAIKANLSLKTIVCAGPTDFFVGKEKTLRWRADRNKKLAQAVANPGSVPLSVWPKIWKELFRCQHGCGPVLRSLKGLGNEIVGPLPMDSESAQLDSSEIIVDEGGGLSSRKNKKSKLYY